MRLPSDAQHPHDRAAATCPVTGLGADFNPFVDPYLASPYPFWLRARSEEPVFYSPELDYWVVTRYADVKAIFADPKTFSASNVQNPIAPLSPKVVAILREGGFGAVPAMSNADPPTHTRIRKFTGQAFTPRRVAKLEIGIRAIVTKFLDQIAPRHGADLVRDMVYELPVLVLFIFLGMPTADVARVKSWAKNRLMLTWGHLSEAEQIHEARGLLEYWRYSRRHVEQLLKNPPDNIVGDLIRARDGDDQVLSIDEIATVVYGLLIAGHETTTSLAGNAIVNLLEHRAAWDELCTKPELIPHAVEEILRYDTSVITWRRRAARAVEIGGVAIPENANLLLAIGSANRDESEFPRSAEFDIHRGNAKEHLAFGFGIHYCFGAPLARLELKVILEELTRRIPAMRLVADQGFTYSANISFRGPQRVLIEW
ncbi:MAG: cytochrome P450 [Candidatus Binataceae bacterium]